ADHEAAREGVVLEDHLVDDAGARLPEAEPVLARSGAQEVVDLVVLGDGPLRIVGGAALRPDQVVAVDGAGDGDPLLPRLDELQQRHLPGGVLERDAVDAQPELRLAPAPLLLVEVVRVGDQDLLGEGEGMAEAAAGVGEPGGHGFVEPPDLVNRHEDLLAARIRALPSVHRRIASHPAEGGRRPCKSETYASMLYPRGQAIGGGESGSDVVRLLATPHLRACTGASGTTWITRRPNLRSARCKRSSFSQREMPGGSVQMTRVS